MASFKVFHIGKANTRIEELENENAALKEAAKTASENAAQVAENAETISAELKRVKSDLATAKASIESLTGQLATSETQLHDAKEKLANPDARITELASKKAQQITATQGQPPVTSSADPGAPRDILAEYEAIKDPTARTEWYRQNKSAYNAAHKAKNPGDMKLGKPINTQK